MEQDSKPVDIKTIGEELLKELNSELTKATDSGKMIEGAIQGIHMFYNKLMEAAQPKSGNSDEPSKLAEVPQAEAN